MSGQNDYTGIISVLGSLFIIVSEALPFIKPVKSNGIIHLMFNTIKQMVDKNLQNAERAPLLGAGNPYIHNSIDETNINSEEILVKIDNLSNILSSTLNTISNTLSLDIQNSRQLKLQQSDLYELNYIINYIKVNYPKKMYMTRFLSKTNKQLLISQGYIVDYDSQNDTNTIKW